MTRVKNAVNRPNPADNPVSVRQLSVIQEQTGDVCSPNAPKMAGPGDAGPPPV
jgi:hypothetical protein